MGDTGPRVERRDADEVFGLLGNETRLAIVTALGETIDESVSFSTLRERVGTRDSGQFNYHLQQLLGTFVTRDDDGYQLTLAGKSLVGALLAGTYTASVALDQIELDGPCPQCGGVLEATLTDGSVNLRCRDCDDWMNEFEFPVGSIEQYDRDALPDAFHRWMWLLLATLDAGFCLNCHGRLETTVEPLDDHPEGVATWYRCGRCGAASRTSVVARLMFHPECVGFLADHGYDLRTTPNWELFSAIALEVTRDGEDAARARLEIDGDVLEVGFRADGSVAWTESS